ncbi:hypothetical protein ABH15_07920 [Methanoculleus taiwanensis]|uniref:Uncharacterized protein n=1 Tax=Methanoculleus taiwanensis TaxID=1550565 RepID=A0A498H0F2_9EURY|nr:hypothetical protein [Methanoculleus taiwanensis]RXE56098.1 hypothetical protein ABH15_07920 [Methanoculleus taiwanensis]
MTRTALIFLLAIALVSVTAASEIVIESDGDQQYLTFVASDSTKIAGYNIQLNYSADTSILDVEALPPYTGVFGIRNDEGWTRIVGFTGGDTYSARLARFTYAGKGNFSIVVYELYDSDLNDVAVSNTIGAMPDATGSPTPTVPAYQPETGYVPPTGTASGSTSTATGGSTGSGVTGNPAPAPSGTPEPSSTVIPAASPALTEGSTPLPTPSPSLAPAVSAETTAKSTEPQTTPRSPSSPLLVISGVIIAAICLAKIRKLI